MNQEHIPSSISSHEAPLHPALQELGFSNFSEVGIITFSDALDVMTDDEGLALIQTLANLGLQVIAYEVCKTDNDKVPGAILRLLQGIAPQLVVTLGDYGSYGFLPTVAWCTEQSDVPLHAFASLFDISQLTGDFVNPKVVDQPVLQMKSPLSKVNKIGQSLIVTCENENDKAELLNMLQKLLQN